MSETTHFRSGLLVFPNLTQLDLTGPYEVLARLPGAETLLLWKNLDPVRSEHGLTILPMATLESSEPLDLILVPGGPGINPLLEDAEVLAFLRRAAAEARYVVGVCTGSLVLAAAGLLRGRRATTHWMSRDLLRSFGAEPVAQRVVVDGKFFTGGGVTAGIDVALTVAAEIAGNGDEHVGAIAGIRQHLLINGECGGQVLGLEFFARRGELRHDAARGRRDRVAGGHGQGRRLFFVGTVEKSHVP